MATWSPKDPADVADYWFDWTDFLPTPETITAATVTAAVGITATAQDHTDKTVRVRLTGGTTGTKYSVTCLISTSSGETFEITKMLSVKDRIVT